jgi:hypothetical protein
MTAGTAGCRVRTANRPCRCRESSPQPPLPGDALAQDRKTLASQRECRLRAGTLRHVNWRVTNIDGSSHHGFMMEHLITPASDQHLMRQGTASQPRQPPVAGTAKSVPARYVGACASTPNASTADALWRGSACGGFLHRPCVRICRICMRGAHLPKRSWLPFISKVLQLPYIPSGQYAHRSI